SALAQAGVTGRDIDHVNAHAHGTSTPLNDAVEAAVLGRLLGDRATVTSAKGVLGHTLGAAGAIEAALTVLSIERSTVPPTANLRRRDPAVDLDVVADAPREQKVELAMSNSFGFGGQNAVLVFASP
ncbi:3-oxoacyl-ACP synthase, partial [Streptomyces violaceoruber]